MNKNKTSRRLPSTEGHSCFVKVFHAFLIIVRLTVFTYIIIIIIFFFFFFGWGLCLLLCSLVLLLLPDAIAVVVVVAVGFVVVDVAARFFSYFFLFVATAIIDVANIAPVLFLALLFPSFL